LAPEAKAKDLASEAKAKDVPAGLEAKAMASRTPSLATFNPTFVCLQMTVSCIVLLDLKMAPVSCKMIYVLYLNGQKLGR